MDTHLPKSTEFQDFLDMMVDNGYEHVGYQYCAGHRLSDLKTGYAYVGGGLSLQTVIDQNPLIAFCDVDCHPEPFDRDQHAMIGVDSTPNCVDTGELVELIQQAIRKAESGAIPYTEEAVEVMREQLRSRGVVSSP